MLQFNMPAVAWVKGTNCCAYCGTVNSWLLPFVSNEVAPAETDAIVTAGSELPRVSSILRPVLIGYNCVRWGRTA